MSDEFLQGAYEVFQSVYNGATQGWKDLTTSISNAYNVIPVFIRPLVIAYVTLSIIYLVSGKDA